MLWWSCSGGELWGVVCRRVVLISFPVHQFTSACWTVVVYGHSKTFRSYFILRILQLWLYFGILGRGGGVLSEGSDSRVSKCFPIDTGESGYESQSSFPRFSRTINGVTVLLIVVVSHLFQAHIPVSDVGPLIYFR